MTDKNKPKEQLVKELAEMRQRMTELEALVVRHQETEDTLRQCTAELEGCYEELNTFARILSRDLRGALGLIISFAQVLEEYHTTLAEEELRRYFDVIAQKGHRMLNIIDKLLEVEAEPPPDSKTDIGPLDMDSVVAEAMEILAYMVDEYQAKIVLPPAGSWPVAMGYAPWVAEVWFNYISNAIQYGGRPPHVKIGAKEQEDGTVRFWVRDNGDGLTSEEQAQLLTPLVRPDQVPTRGHGLGLVIVHRILEKLGGEFGFESEGVPGKGSLFYFTLPLAKEGK